MCASAASSLPRCCTQLLLCAQVNRATALIQELLVPMDDNHEYKRRQLMELAVINGTGCPFSPVHCPFLSPSPHTHAPLGCCCPPNPLRRPRRFVCLCVCLCVCVCVKPLCECNNTQADWALVPPPTPPPQILGCLLAGTQVGDVLCHNCGEKGHRAWECPKRMSACSERVRHAPAV